jgi:hypothetical protein
VSSSIDSKISVAATELIDRCEPTVAQASERLRATAISDVTNVTTSPQRLTSTVKTTYVALTARVLPTSLWIMVSPWRRTAA